MPAYGLQARVCASGAQHVWLSEPKTILLRGGPVESGIALRALRLPSGLRVYGSPSRCIEMWDQPWCPNFQICSFLIKAPVWSFWFFPGPLFFQADCFLLCLLVCFSLTKTTTLPVQQGFSPRSNPSWPAFGIQLFAVLVGSEFAGKCFW